MPAVFDRALSGKDVSMLIQFHSDNNRTLLVPMRISAGRIELSIPVTVRSGSGGRGGWRRSRSPQPSAFCGARSFPAGILGRPAGERSFALGSPLRGSGPQASMIGPHLDFPRPGTWRGCTARKGSAPSPPASGGCPTPVADRPASWRTRDWAGRRIDALGASLTRVRVPSWRVEPQPAHGPWLASLSGLTNTRAAGASLERQIEPRSVTVVSSPVRARAGAPGIASSDHCTGAALQRSSRLSVSGGCHQRSRCRGPGCRLDRMEQMKGRAVGCCEAGFL